jgi:hypothetical protein
MMRNAMPLRGCCMFRSGSKTTGLPLLSHNPVSHPSSVGTVKCDVYQAEATGIGPLGAFFPLGRLSSRYAPTARRGPIEASHLPVAPAAEALG